ncbi:TolC family protein [Vibrio sp. JC009]|uniref:TolC family protein n=1 Tax=Vibrio sp. JC009 TaxID=2912314 RepID=UPI0023B1E29E|nr:TolC family protein [Vibrio sp. JC009]WED23292.1 TolC family protein [Vibrio sp. JC009]
MKGKNSSRLVVSLLACSIFSASAQQMRFAEAWQVLQTKNNSIAAQRANVERYKQQEEASKALNYPSVSLGANYTILDQDVKLTGEDLIDSLDSNTVSTLSTLLPALSGGALTLSGLAESYSTITEREILHSSITAVWPIYTGGRITAAQKVAESQTDEAEANLAIEAKKRYQDLARYYFSVVLAREVVETRKTVEAGLTKHRNNAIKLQEQGQIAKVERLQAEASLDHAVVDRKSSEKDLEIAISALTEILNQDSPVVPETTLFINDSLPPLAAFTEQTLNTYPGLDVLRAKEKQANQLIKAEKGTYHPEVYLYGNYTVYEEESLASSLTPDWLVGVGVSIPLIDNSGRSENVKSAKSALLQVNHLKAQAEQDLTVLVKKTYYEAEKAMEEAQGLESSLKLAKENLNLRNKAFKQGLSTSVDVVDAELYLASIRTQQLAAKYNYLISLNTLLALANEIQTFNQYELSADQNKTNEETL